MTGLRRLLVAAGLPVRHTASSVLLGALTLCFGVALMATAGYLISRAAERPPILSLMITIVAVRFFGLARPLTRYAERLTSHDLSLRGLARIRARFFERIEPLAPAQLEPYRHGELLERMVGDVDALGGVYLKGLVSPLASVAAGVICVLATAVFLPRAGVILAAGLVVGGVFVPMMAGALARRTGRRQAGLRAELVAELVDTLRGAPELAVYGCTEDALARLRSDDRELTGLGARDARIGGLSDALSILVSGLTATGVLALAVSAHESGVIDRVLVAMLALLAVSSSEVVSALPAAARELSSIFASGRRVLELIDREPAVHDPVDPLPPPLAPAVVTLENVTARYAPHEPAVLTGLDLRLDPVARIALVGASGAGKSTIASLLLRFLDPQTGRVTIAGRDLRDYRQRDIRRFFALAGQNAHIFDSTIRANLVLARPGATDAELEAALHQARILEWVVGLPDGLDTLVGQAGTQLSGGQRQRLTVARALLADAPVLILDEPTAHLDPQTAEELMQEVFEAAGGRTILLMTHRPEGLELVDRIIRLDA